MPVYNAAPYVQASILSILSQTFTDFELLVFNDGSTDASGDVIDAITDTRITLINVAKNCGYVAHLNAGLAMARGKYIARMDADDIALPNRFARQISLLENHPEIGLCGTAYQTFDAQDTTVAVPLSDAEIRGAMLWYNPVGHPTVMFRRELIERHGLRYDPEYMPAEDYKLWYDLSLVTQLQNLPEVLLRYRVHAHQISAYMNGTQRANADKVRVLQLLDKGFRLTPTEQKLYCQLIHRTSLPQTSLELRRWLAVMWKIKHENQRLRAYEDHWFDSLFEQAWQEAIAGIKQYNPAHLWPVLLQRKPMEHSGDVAAKMRIAVKSLLFWKARTTALESMMNARL